MVLRSLLAPLLEADGLASARARQACGVGRAGGGSRSPRRGSRWPAPDPLADSESGGGVQSARRRGRVDYLAQRPRGQTALWMSPSNRPTRPFGHSDLPTLPPAPAASPRLRRAAGKEGRLATDHPATPARGCAARFAVSECADVLEDRKRRPDASSGPSAWAQASFARRSPSREVRNPSRVLHSIIGRRRRREVLELR